MNKDIVEIYVDGSIRKNGKEGAFGGVGVVAFYKDKCVLKHAQLVKSATNNESEYWAVLRAIVLGEFFTKDYIIYSDSQLIVNQIKGKYSVDKPSLLDFYNKTMFAIDISKHYKDIKWIPREENKEADKLAQSITKEAL